MSWEKTGAFVSLSNLKEIEINKFDPLKSPPQNDEGIAQTNLLNGEYI